MADRFVDVLGLATRHRVGAGSGGRRDPVLLITASPMAENGRRCRASRPPPSRHRGRSPGSARASAAKGALLRSDARTTTPIHDRPSRRVGPGTCAFVGNSLVARWRIRDGHAPARVRPSRSSRRVAWSRVPLLLRLAPCRRRLLTRFVRSHPRRMGGSRRASTTARRFRPTCWSRRGGSGCTPSGEFVARCDRGSASGRAPVVRPNG